MKNKRNVLLYIIIILLLIVIILLSVMLLKKDDKLLDDNDSINDVVDNVDDTLDNNQEVIYSGDELFSKLTGIWRYVSSEGTNYAVRFFVYDDEMRFSYGMYGTDYGVFGVITDIQHKDGYNYQLTVFSAGCHGDDCFEERDDTTYNIDIDVSNIDSKNIIVYDNNYDYVADTWEEAESSFSY